MHTCTDVIEEIISEEIVDETDQFEDNQSKRRAKRMTTAAVMRGCVSLLTHFSHTADDGRWILALSRENVDPNQQFRIPKSARHC
jgi:CBS domain containing-hemolysin-like protein